MSKSFLERVQPHRQRWKLIEWPFPVEGERPKVKLRVLGHDESEAAYFATVDHFKKRKVAFTDPAFEKRERVELVWRAYSADGEPLAADADEMAKQPIALIDELFRTYSQFFAAVAAPPPSADDMDALVELLKKNIPEDLLGGFASNWLIALIGTLANRLALSTTANSDGL